MGLAADLGVLQRLPKLIGSLGTVYEWALTGRRLTPAEALSSGLVTKVTSKEDLLSATYALAALVASKSPVVTQGIKKAVTFALDHSILDGLDQICTWNSAMLQSNVPSPCPTSRFNPSFPHTRLAS